MEGSGTIVQASGCSPKLVPKAGGLELNSLLIADSNFDISTVFIVYKARTAGSRLARPGAGGKFTRKVCQATGGLMSSN